MIRAHLILAFLFIGILLSQCASDDKKPAKTPSKPTTNTQPTGIHPGKTLSDQFCGNCHEQVGPEALDTLTWRKYVLVRMGAYMGIYWDTRKYYDEVPQKWLEPGEGGERVLNAGIYPKKPLMSREEWEQIVDYYYSNAPPALHGPANALPIAPKTARFRVKPLQQKAGLQAFVTGVKIDGPRQKMYAAFYKQALLEMTPDGRTNGMISDILAVVDINTEKGRISLTNIGNMVGADKPSGTFRTGASFKDLQNKKDKLQIDTLMRPVQSIWHDLDQDGLEDLLLCEFGNQLGTLSWRKNLGNGTFEKRPLHYDDGAVRAHIHDFNGDGRPDIIALMANADEGIDLYLNQGKGEFKRQRILRFPPTNGSTGLQLIDYNKDGQMDLLYLNGDNADYPAILKPHHGIRIFLNQGNLKFEEALYLPLNGTYNAQIADFDLDGDYDIAAISFYPDFSKQPGEGFVYFENQGKNVFKASTVPEALNSRWMVCDAGDLDQDGDIDLLLGAFNAPSSEVPDDLFQRWQAADTPLLLLENLTK